MRIPIAAALTAATIALAAPAVASAQLEPEECVTQGLAGTPYAPGINCRQIDVDGALRRYVVYVPTTRPVTGSRAPVVMMFHGSSGTGEQFLRISGWREQADAQGLVAVFPTGLRYRMLDTGRNITKWNDLELKTEVDLGERPHGYPADAPMPADDVGFADAMMTDVGTQLPIDGHRIYASGFSNGANFTARLAVERADRLAAVGFAAGGLPVDALADPIPTPARPIPMFGIVGTLDDRILDRANLPELPLNPVTLLGTFPIDAFMRVHVATLGLDERFYGALASPNSTFFSWPGTNPTFRFGVLAGLDHHYPNARNNDNGFEAAPEFWRFFLAHPLP